MRINATLTLAFLVIALVFYLSWLPQPRLGLNWFMPDWLARWADDSANDTIRTGVPFVFLGCLTGIFLIMRDSSWKYWFTSWFGLILVVATAELGQTFLPNRYFDLWDIAWGIFGSLLGLVLAYFSTIIIKLLKIFPRGN